ncbi:hypothetical protein XENORESO_010908 [Xenotaenia resolanae]|uniref:C-type lectin domain-containing protein n=1 Tax=Xenotaenia resolanae TaxID=208358 RepID=A0ABV0VXR5_9TELE
MSKDLAARIRQLFCVYGAKLGHLDVDLKALSSSFKEKLATFCPSVYYISSTMKTWKESRRDCLERGADLVIINSKEEQELLRRFQNRIWIGLTDADIEGEWKWVDGTQLITSYWGFGEPNSFGGKDEDCGEIQFFKEENNWNDAPCNLKNYWICEEKLQ